MTNKILKTITNLPLIPKLTPSFAVIELTPVKKE